MPQHRASLVALSDTPERRGMRGIKIVPIAELAFDIGVSDTLKANQPRRRLAAQHTPGLGQRKSHGSASIEHAVDLGNGLAHLLFDALDTKSVALRDLGITQALYALREEDLAGPRFEFSDHLLETAQRVTRLQNGDLVNHFVQSRIGASRSVVQHPAPAPVAQQVGANAP